jgi:predicted MPP superfamily phosphohydrolase
VDWLVRRRRGSAKHEGEGPSRRQLLHQGANATVVGGAALVGLGSFAGARRRASVVRVEVPLAGLPAGLDGFRFVQITDLHVGFTIGRDYVAEVAEAVDALAADAVVITGDLTDGTVDDLHDAVSPLSDMRSRHGTFFVTGNHDYYFGAGEDWVEHTQRLGMIPLINDHHLIAHDGGRLLLAGVGDHSAGNYVPSHACDPAAAIEDAPDADARVLLAHQPRTLDLAAPLEFDLQLSGHTHGGQMLPFHALALLQQPFLAGLHPVGRGFIYVSRGTGYWGPPFRTAAPSEITLIRLIRAE